MMHRIGHANKILKWERTHGLYENENNCIQNALRRDPTNILDNMTHMVFILETPSLLKAVNELSCFNTTIS